MFELYANDLYRYVRLTLGGHEAMDVVQEVFLRAFRSWDTFRHDANEKTWLFTIARNYIFDLLRKKRTETNFLQNYDPPFAKDETATVETFIVLEQALTHLKKTYRHVFVLRHVENLTVQETAQVLGWSESKVRTTDHRAIGQLRKLLDPGAKEVLIHGETRPGHH